MSAPIVFLDTETDGVHPGRRPWEIAMIRRDEQGERSISFFLEITLKTADPFGLRVGRFYDRHPLGQWLSGQVSSEAFPRPDEEDGYLSGPVAAYTVARWTHGAHLIGAVPGFDAGVLDKLLRAHGLIPSWHYHLLDTEAVAVGYLLGRGLHNTFEVALPWKSDQLSRACGVEPPSEAERHQAFADADWARRLWDAINSGM